MDNTRCYSSDVAFIPTVKALQTRKGSRRAYGRLEERGAWNTRITPGLAEFIAAQTSIFLATANTEGQPYIQHRGGPAGFLRVLTENVIAFADVRGNRQLLSTGNVAANDRVALFLMDYPQRSRLKILGHARVIAANDDPELATRLSVNGVGPVERLFTIEVVAFDWNCPKYITPRYTRAEVEEFAAPLRNRITELESKLSAIEAQKRELHS